MTKTTLRYHSLRSRNLCPSCRAPRFRHFARCKDCLYVQRESVGAHAEPADISKGRMTQPNPLPPTLPRGTRWTPRVWVRSHSTPRETDREYRLVANGPEGPWYSGIFACEVDWESYREVTNK